MSYKLEIVDELYELVKNFFGYKVKMLSINSEKKEVQCILYDSFLLKCGIGNRYNMFGMSICFGFDQQSLSLTDFLGQKVSMSSDKDSIIENLKIVDNYCRMRLPDKFLDAYCRAYE